MMQGEENQRLTFSMKYFRINHRIHILNDIGIRKHDSLGTSGRSGCIDNYSSIVVVIGAFPCTFGLICNGGVIFEDDDLWLKSTFQFHFCISLLHCSCLLYTSDAADEED